MKRRRQNARIQSTQPGELTAADLGKIIGVDSSHAAKIIRGDRSITATHAKKFARHCAVSVEALLA